MSSAVHPRAPRERGFSLLEILVTLAIIAIALLGTAYLQALTLKTGKSGQLREQAVVLATNLLERMEANNAGVVAGSYTVATLPAALTTDCASDFCAPADLAVYDLFHFRNAMANVLPGATVVITRSGAGPYVYAVVLSWVERITKSAGTATAAGGSVAANGKTETFSFTVSKSFYDRSLIY